MPLKKIEGLQVARAIAAITVAYYHSYIALRGFPESAQMPIEALKNWGYLGVNFFFAISGYVICLVASKPKFEAIPFAIKRLFRLYPMYWAAMATVLVMIYLGKYRVEPIGHFLYSMTLLPQEGAPAYDVSWTLEREMVFYLLAAITVPLAGVPGLAAVMALLAAGGWYLGNPWTFHLVSTTQADFLAGVIVFLLHHHLARVGAFVPIIIGGGALWLTRSHGFVFDVPICMAVILAGTINLRLPWQRSPFRWIVSAGNASYSIYLLHYILFYWAAVLSARLPWTPPDWMCEPWRYAAIVVCCFISDGTWKVIEEPANRFAERLVALRVRRPEPGRAVV